MNANKSTKKQQRVSRRGAGGDVITVTDIGPGSVVAAGRSAAAHLLQSADPQGFERWRREIENHISMLPGLSTDERLDTKEQIQKIAAEAIKGKHASPQRLEKLVNTLAVMSPDIFEVAIASLINPMAGIGLVLKKIGDKARIEPATGN